MYGWDHVCNSRDTKTFFLPAETVENHETRPNHERIASVNDQSESTEKSRLKEI